MPEGYFITFRPTEGVFEEAIKPHRIWRKRSDMSRRIDIDGAYYRVVRTIGWFRKLWVEKMVVCDEKGHIVEDEDITRRCFRVIMNIGYYQFNQEGIAQDATYQESEERSKRESLVKLFKQMWNSLEPVLSESETELMAYHLNFLQEFHRLKEEGAEISKRVLDAMGKIEQRTDDTYPPDWMEQYIDAAAKNYQLKNQFEALLVESREKTGSKVRKILQSSEYFKHLQSFGSENRLLVVNDIADSSTEAEKFLYQSKKEREVDKKWLDDISGSFSIEKHIYELRHIDDFARAVRRSLIATMHDNWLLSPHCKFK